MQIFLTSTIALNESNCHCPSDDNCFNFELMEIHSLEDLLRLGSSLVVTSSKRYDHTLPKNSVVVEIYNDYRE